MNNKYKLLVVVLIGGAIITAFLPAAAADLQTDFASAIRALTARVTLLESQVTDLFEKVSNIQLIPGSQGPVGPEGPQGPAGTSSTDLYVYDANDQNLGILLSVTPADARVFNTYLSTSGIFLDLRQSDGPETVVINNIGSPIYFSSDNCIGAAYIPGGNPGGTVISHTGRAFKIIDGTKVNGLNSWSRLTSGCENGQGITSLLNPLQEVSLPFNLPLSWPLEVRVN